MKSVLTLLANITYAIAAATFDADAPAYFTPKSRDLTSSNYSFNNPLYPSSPTESFDQLFLHISNPSLSYPIPESLNGYLERHSHWD